MTEEFYIGQIFYGTYPGGAAEWCNNQDNPYITIEEIEPQDGERVFKIVDITPTTEEQAKEREEQFNKDFFKVQYNGQDLYFRKQPKGYSSAVESINTAFNIVNTIGTLPAGSLVFYQQPDFTDKTQCTEEWLVEHQVKSEQMSVTEFGTFYAGFITVWNTQEHE